MQLLLIAAAGAVGAVLRYGVGKAAQPLGGDTFPAGTLIVNLTGCFLLGLLATYFLERTSLSSEVRTMVTVGFLGAYTTFSTFEYETLELFNDGQWHYALLNIGVSVGAGLLAVWVGQTLARI